MKKLKNKKRFLLLVITFFVISLVISKVITAKYYTHAGRHAGNIVKSVPVNKDDSRHNGFNTVSAVNNGANEVNSRGSIKIPILMYHQIDKPASALSVPKENFEAQMKYLKDNGYNIIDLDEFYLYKKNNSTLPVKPVIITFDDGNEDNYTNAYPILKKYNYKATIFVITNFVGRPGYLTWAEITEMKNSGLIEIESHTLNHPMLTRLIPSKAGQEISESKRIIEGHIGAAVNFFAYPYGDYNEKVASLVQEAGYEGAVITNVPGVENRADKNSNPYEVRRVFIGGKFDLAKFALALERPYLVNTPPAKRPAKPFVKLPINEKRPRI